MCVGPFAPKMPQMPTPQRQAPAPTMKAAAPPPETVTPEEIKKESGEELIDTKKKKALEIKKVKEGVKQFGAIDPKSMPQGPEGGVNIP